MVLVQRPSETTSQPDLRAEDSRVNPAKNTSPEFETMEEELLLAFLLDDQD